MTHKNKGTNYKPSCRAVTHHPICKHCEEQKPTFGRGLCQACWKRHRQLYPKIRLSPQEYAERARENQGDNGPKKHPKPTDAMPSSEAKIIVLQHRVLNGEGLWHPADAKDSDDYPGWLAPSPLGILLSSPGEVASVLPGVGSVNLPDDFSGVAEPIGDPFECVPVLDRFAGETMPQAVSREILGGCVCVQADTITGSAEVSAPHMARPFAPVAVREDVFARVVLLQPAKESNGYFGEWDQSRFAGLLPGLVLLQANAADLPLDVCPKHLAHLTGSTASVPHEEQCPTKRTRTCTHQGDVLGVQRRAPRLWHRPLEQLGEAVGTFIDELTFFIIGPPAEATNDRGDGTLLGMLRLPIWVGPKPFRQIELVTVLHEPISDKIGKVVQGACAVAKMLARYVPDLLSAFKGPQVCGDESLNGDRLGGWLFIEDGDCAHC